MRIQVSWREKSFHLERYGRKSHLYVTFFISCGHDIFYVSMPFGIINIYLQNIKINRNIDKIFNFSSHKELHCTSK